MTYYTLVKDTGKRYLDYLNDVLPESPEKITEARVIAGCYLPRSSKADILIYSEGGGRYIGTVQRKKGLLVWWSESQHCHYHINADGTLGKKLI